jgi:aspartyl-tRNA(Asn)/glutamyl-tRNA(Gln) amidotransferase subunit B
MPGVLPVLNKTVVDHTLAMALAVNCTVAPESRFARKNYFYPDLPKGYQISQYELPIAYKGYLDIESGEHRKRIGITRIHMEEDAGKLVHDPDRPYSRVDFNRTGVPLIEIVSEPDIRSPEEAGAYLRHLRSILRYLNISDGNMEEGSFRCDANVSIRSKGSEPFGTRTEVKNLNSFKHVGKALQYEIRRQTDVLMHGDQVIQETRLWDPEKERTTSMRGKEEAHDYRYFPDPDLLPLLIDDGWVERIRAGLPELPAEKRDRFVREYGLPHSDAVVLTGSRQLADYFEACLKAGPDPKPVSNWIMGPLMAHLNVQGKSITDAAVSPNDLAGLIHLIATGVISSKIAKTVFDDMVQSGNTAEQIVNEKGLVQVTDRSTIESVVDEVLAACPSEAEAYREGRTKVFGYLVGQVMKQTRGKANPKLVNDLLKEKLSIVHP